MDQIDTSLRKWVIVSFLKMRFLLYSCAYLLFTCFIFVLCSGANSKHAIIISLTLTDMRSIKFGKTPEFWLSYMLLRSLKNSNYF